MNPDPVRYNLPQLTSTPHLPMKILFAIDGSPQALAALERLVGKFAILPRNAAAHAHPCAPPVPYKAATHWVGQGGDRIATTPTRAMRRSRPHANS